MRLLQIFNFIFLKEPLTKTASKNTVWNGCFEEDVVAKRFCCCCESEPLTVSMSLSKTGFVPGESITINSEICNYSDSTVQKSALRLMMVSEYLRSIYSEPKKKLLLCFSAVAVLLKKPEIVK